MKTKPTNAELIVYLLGEKVVETHGSYEKVCPSPYFLEHYLTLLKSTQDSQALNSIIESARILAQDNNLDPNTKAISRGAQLCYLEATEPLVPLLPHSSISQEIVYALFMKINQLPQQAKVWVGELTELASCNRKKEVSDWVSDLAYDLAGP